ncbi:MAG: heme ABC exporter ATP-binding protein CcmA [Aggregatilineales bacterium]
MSDVSRPIIEIENLTKAYGYLPVLKKISLEIQHGQFVTLLGANGSGKSTLLRLIAGLSPATGGTIRVGGWEIPGEAAAVRAQLGMLGHQSMLYGNLTALENLQFFARLYNLSSDERATRIPALLKEVGLSKRANSPIRTFSRGMQQRLSIARAVLHDPAILLLDEPYSGLDRDAASTLDILLQQHHAAGKTLIMTTHALERAAYLAERVIILKRGRIAYDETGVSMTGMALASLYTQITGAVVAD